MSAMGVGKVNGSFIKTLKNPITVKKAEKYKVSKKYGATSGKIE